MDRNTITGLVVIFAILIGYSIWMTPSKEEKEAFRHQQDSIAQINRVQDSITLVRLIEQHRQDSIRIANEPAQTTETNTDELTDVNRDKLGIFANSSVGNEELFVLESEKLKLRISSKGGKIVSVQLKEFQTYDTLPLNLFNPGKTYFGLTFFASNRIINTNELFFQPVWVNNSVNGSGSLSMRLYTDASESGYDEEKYIEFLYTLKGNDYMMDFDINFVGMDQFVDQGTNFIDLTWNSEKVYPAARYSDRVGFGTGPAMLKGKDGDWSGYPVYPFEYFDEVKFNYDLFSDLFLKDVVTPLDEFIQQKFGNQNIWQPLRENFKTKENFIQACHHKLDGFRIFQYLKWRNSENNFSDEENLIRFLEKFYVEKISSLGFDFKKLDFIKTSIQEFDELRKLFVGIEEEYQKE